MSDETIEPQELPNPSDTEGVVELIDSLMVAIQQARGIPLSDQVRVDRESFLVTLERIKADLPQELRTARYMIRERDAYVARTNEKAKAAVEQAQARSRELVNESYVLAEAVEEANTLVRHAEGDSRRIRLEAEDYAEDRLRDLEVLFANLLKQVRAARSEFHQPRPAAPDVPGT